MAVGYRLKAERGIDMDSDESVKSLQHAAFIKGLSRDSKDNPGVQLGGEGENQGSYTPDESTEVIMPADFPLPAGTNYYYGHREAQDLKELYVFVFNSKKNHFLYRVNADGTLQMVKVEPDWDFVLDPRYFIHPGRCAIISSCVYNKASGQQETRKEMIFTNDHGPLYYLNIEDCIATNGFDKTAFPFFQYAEPYNEWLINQGLPYSFAEIGITPIPATAADGAKENRLDDQSFKFRIKYIDVWGRESEHGVISRPYYNSTSGCLQSSKARTRCLSLSLHAGPPTIAQIQVEFATCSGNTAGLSVESDWYICEVLDKYDMSNPNLQWWQRKINPDLNFNTATNRINYTFCNDKNKTAIPTAQTNRKFNPIPLTVGTVVSQRQNIVTANHKKNFPPLTRDILKSLKFTVEKPSPSTICAPKAVNITVYAIIISPQADFNPAALHKDGTDVIFGADKPNLVREAGQVLPAGQTGIIGYFAGSGEYAISTQCRYNLKSGEIVETGVEDWAGGQPTDVNVIVPIQRWQFKGIAPGRKLFRIASHKATPLDDFQKTSTNVAGLTTFLTHREPIESQDATELEINACDKDVDLTKTPFMIYDLTSDPGGVRKITNSICGYLYEDEVNKIPIERARVSTTAFTNHSGFTDHNGYFWSVNKKKNWHLQLFGTKKGKKNQLLAETEESFDAPGARFRMQTLYMYKGDQEYPESDRIRIKGKVLLCNGGATGVSNVPLVITNGATGSTDSNGAYTIIAHDGGENGNRSGRLIFGQGGKCILTACGGTNCNYCFEAINWTAPGTTGSTRTVTLADFRVNVQNLNIRGPQNGARYEMVLQAFDWLGRTNGSENTPDYFLDIPSIQETGVFGYSKIFYQFDPQVVFPSYIRNITIGIGQNLNWGDFTTWYIEKVEKIDQSGKINKVNPTQIKLYYRGMIEYNIQNGLSTNTNWDVVDQEEKVITGDRIEFIVNGDGKIFPTRITSLVRHDTEGSFMIIDYQDELKGLIDGCMIKIMRPRDTATSNIYNEYSLEIQLVNGKVPVSKQKGYIDFVDSYMFNRQIPIPSYDDKNNKVPELTQIKNVPLPFEHHSPSDFWGDHCSSRGRSFAKDPYVSVQCRPTEVAVSKALINDGLINGLSYFDEADFKVFDKNDWGGIVHLVPRTRSFFVICEHKTFFVSFDDNVLRTRGDKIVAVGAGERFGDPEQRGGSHYGCQPADVNTICEYNGVVSWIDSSQSAWLMGNEETVVDMSTLGCSGWLKDKIKHAQQFNTAESGKSMRKYFHAIFDPHNDRVILTSFALPVHGMADTIALTDVDYVNTLREKKIERNEALGLNPFTKEIVQFYHFTPEAFGTLSSHIWDKQLISFRGGVPHIHHKTFNRSANTYLNIYGVQCDPVFEVILNIEDDKVKQYLYTQVFCKQQLFFCDRILTQSGQRSRLLIPQFREQLKFWSAAFRGDLLTAADKNSDGLKDPAKKILEGNFLYGDWIRVRYVGVPKNSGKYFEFNGVTIHVNAVEKSGK